MKGNILGLVIIWAFFGLAMWWWVDEGEYITYTGTKEAFSAEVVELEELGRVEIKKITGFDPDTFEVWYFFKSKDDYPEYEVSTKGDSIRILYPAVAIPFLVIISFALLTDERS